MLDSWRGQLYASSHPPDSLNLDLLLLDAAGLPALLSESLTLESLSSETDVPIPGFPSAYQPPPLAVVDLGECLHMWPHGWSRKPTRTKGEGNDKVILAAPTVPRLQSMLRENISISKWMEPVTLCAQPDHRDMPWDLVVNEDKPMIWRPEGSIFSPEAMRAAIAARRRGTSCRLDSPQNRHVFQREVTLKADGTKGLRYQIAANTMKPETVKIMLELQSLNSYFRESLDEAEDSLNVVPGQTDKPLVPVIMVSDSRFAFPLSMESSDTLGFESLPSLAARRGKESLPPLFTAANCEIASLSYPSIPAAFLGSPSSHSPKFEFDPHDDSTATVDLPIGVQEMIVSLRSRCATMGPTSPDTELSMTCSELEKSSGSRDESRDSDEWAFAESLLGDFGSQLPYVRPPKTPSMEKTPLPHTEPQAAETISPAVATRKSWVPRRSKTMSRKQSILPAISVRQDDCIVSKEHLKSLTTPSPPLRPAFANPPSQGSSEKARKTVRFATLPNQRHCSAPLPTPIVRPRRLANVFSGQPQSVVASPLEDKIGDDRLVPPTRPPTSTKCTSESLRQSIVSPRSRPRSTHSLSMAPFSAHDTKAVSSREQVNSNILGQLHLPPGKIGNFPLTEKNTKLKGKEALSPSPRNSISPQVTPNRSTPLEKAPPPWLPQSFMKHSFGRHSLSRIMKSPTVGKENEGQGTGKKLKRKTYSSASPSGYSPSTPPSERVNENAARRGSGSVSKSRMPIPLRKILTRFTQI